jgi:hypothetical protein
MVEATGAAVTCAWSPFEGVAAAVASSEEAAPVRKPAPLVNVAKNRAVYQSSSIDDDHTGHLVTDGSDLTYWQCQPQGEQWIAIDLGRMYPLTRVTVLWGKLHAGQYRLEVSAEDGRPTHWQSVLNKTDGLGGEEELTFPRTDARHLRLIGQADSVGQGFSICEVKVWSEKPRSPASLQLLAKNGTLLTDGWSVTNAMFVNDGPATISMSTYQSDWLPAVVPGTVLTSYLTAGAIPDPLYANQQQQISEEFFTRNDFWYRNIFDISAACRGKRLWIVFAGVNWKADVYLNGKQLGSIEGAYLRQRFEITGAAICGGRNCLAVLIHKVAHPGEVQHKQLGQLYPNGGVLGLDSPTSVASIGWNWIPTIRGRNIGIWDDILFEWSGDVLVVDPWVTSSVSSDKSEAQLAARTELTNLSESPRQCTLTLRMGESSYRRRLTLQPHETRQIVIDHAAWPALKVKDPQLWWPNGYGEQTLHTMKFEVESGTGISDEKTVTFGIRTVEGRTEDGGLKLFVNGRRILCRGGNWGMEDAMMRCDRDGYDLRVRMHRDMNLVMIRNWVGMVLRDAFYEACDRHGLLVWDDFWLANPDNGPNPDDHARFMLTARDKISRVRHHACVGFYCGRNEGAAPADLDAAMKAAVEELDGTRYYLPNSASGVVTGYGPYELKDPAWYFEHRGTTFHSEQGIVCVPPVESMRAMMPEPDLWPISDMWAIHDYQQPRSVLYTQRIGSRYGTPASIEEYCRKAQMVNLESAKAICECLQSGQGGGLLIWMTQAAWPCVICQLYDYYFEQTAAYFGAKKACEPIHIFWNQHTNFVEVANNTLQDCGQLRVHVQVFDLYATNRWSQTALLDVPSTSKRACFTVEKPDGVCFIKLELRSDTQLLSENFYWTASNSGDCLALNDLPTVDLHASARYRAEKSEHTVAATVFNPSASVALAIRLKLLRSASGERVLPAMYEDNYFSLLPGERKHVKISFPGSALAGQAPRLVVEGWNVRQHAVPFL